MTTESECLFCRIVSGAIPAQVVRDEQRVLAFRDLAPQAPTHVLVIPKAHHDDVGALAQADPAALVDLVNVAADIAGKDADGQFRLVFNTGVAAGQTVGHVHGHVLGGRPLTWPPG